MPAPAERCGMMNREEIFRMGTAIRIDGKARAAELSATIRAETEALLAEKGLKPGLAVVIVGEDPASQVYVRNKKRTAESCGFHSVQHTLTEDASQDDVLGLHGGALGRHHQHDGTRIAQHSRSLRGRRPPSVSSPALRRSGSSP